MKNQFKMLIQNTAKLKLTLLIYPLMILFVIACGANDLENKSEEMDQAEKIPAAKKVAPKKLSLGEKAFIMCHACHSVKKDEPHKVGPNLHGLFGRKAGTEEGFNYSEALKKSDIIWDETHLRNWLEKPTDYIPGTTMAFIGIQDEAQQTALIEHLKELTK